MIRRPLLACRGVFSCALLLNLNGRRKLLPAWQAVVGMFSHCGHVFVRRGNNARGQWVGREGKEALRQLFLERKCVGCKRRER